MSRKRFPLTSDQLELLLAFEKKTGLIELAEVMAKDPSVVSRNLQRIAETLPVLEKTNNRWQITSLGKQINSITSESLDRFLNLIDKRSESEDTNVDSCFSLGAVLVVINAQKALLYPSNGNRNNHEAEKNIQQLLTAFREQQKRIVHVKHVSTNPKSQFFPESEGSSFIADLAPLENEIVLKKAKSSVFTETTLQQHLNEWNADTLIFVGFTANDCIDASARQASELGFTTYVVSDATASFDISTQDGNLYRADRIHDLTMANLNALYAKVIDTDYLLNTP